MPKEETLFIQNEIQKLGEKLGFISKTEKQLKKTKIYSPIVDVAWFIDLTQFFDLSSLKPLFVNNEYLFDSLSMFPIAGFEIEGSTVNSKTQVGNIANLYISNYYLKFAVVNNDGAGNEKDTYRRLRKIKNYFTDFIGESNIIFADWVHIKKSMENIDFSKLDIKVSNEILSTRSAVGGETKSIPIFDRLKDYFNKTGLMLKENYKPIESTLLYRRDQSLFRDVIGDELLEFYLKKKYYFLPNQTIIKEAKKITDVYYIPRLDLMAGFYMPDSMLLWLFELAQSLGNDVVDNLLLYNIGKLNLDRLFIQLISCEIETSNNKHLNGGVINMAKSSYIGLLVASSNALSHLRYLQDNLGLNNIAFVDYEKF